jgi:hypothetical protein
MKSPVATLRAIVLEHFPKLRWRHHGIGALQAYIREHADPEVRVHVWHPALVRPGIRFMGDAHDHRFDMESTVLVGSLPEVYIGQPEPDPEGNWWIYRVENARSAGPEKGYDGDTAPISRQRYRAHETQRIHCEGDTYYQRRGTFHATRPCELAITIVTMREKRESARILVPWGYEPVHAFSSDPTPDELIARILRDAEDRLR